MSIKLSVCMITYNHEKYIVQAIESILMQKVNFEYEIIIGEDCSMDNTPAIVLSYAIKYSDKIKPILNNKNIGMIPNFINTLNNCKGKYVAMLEGDDFWIDSYKLQKQVDFLENNPDYGLVHGDYNRLTNGSGQINYCINKQVKIPIGYVYEDLLKTNFISTLTVVTKNDLIQKAIKNLYLNKKDWQLGDYPLWLEISRHTKVGYIDEALATYRLLLNSKSHNKSKLKELIFNISVHNIRNYFINKYECNVETKKYIMNNYYNSIIMYAYILENKKYFDVALDYFKSNNIKLTFKYKIYYLSYNIIIIRLLIRIIGYIKKLIKSNNLFII